MRIHTDKKKLLFISMSITIIDITFHHKPNITRAIATHALYYTYLPHQTSAVDQKNSCTHTTSAFQNKSLVDDSTNNNSNNSNNNNSSSSNGPWQTSGATSQQQKQEKREQGATTTSPSNSSLSEDGGSSPGADDDMNLQLGSAGSPTLRLSSVKVSDVS